MRTQDTVESKSGFQSLVANAYPYAFTRPQTPVSDNPFTMQVDSSTDSVPMNLFLHVNTDTPQFREFVVATSYHC